MNQLFLKPDEGKFLVMAVMESLEAIQRGSQDERLNWNPKARRQYKEMLAAGNSLKIKLQKLGFPTNLPPFMEGDQDQFLTKES